MEVILNLRGLFEDITRPFDGFGDLFVFRPLFTAVGAGVKSDASYSS
jgi:hypothetical protein